MNKIEELTDQIRHINARLDQLEIEIEEINQHNIFNSNALFAIQEGMKNAHK